MYIGGASQCGALRKRRSMMSIQCHSHEIDSSPGRRVNGRLTKSTDANATTGHSQGAPISPTPWCAQ